MVSSVSARASFKKTLGYFLAELRKRVDVLPSFDANLTEFLEKRNTFVHHVTDIDGWDLATPEGIAVAKKFIGRLMALNAQVMDVSLGVLRSWQKQNDWGPFHPWEEAFFKRIDEQMVPLVDDIFFQKGTT